MRIPGSVESHLKSRPLHTLTLKEMQSSWLHSLSAWYGKDTLKIGLQIYPNGLSLLRLARIRSAVGLIQARLEEQPSLGPLLAADPGMWSNLSDWKIIKNRLVAQGLLQGSWRWLARAPRAYIAKMDWGNLSHICWVNMHAAINHPDIRKFVDWQTGAVVGFSGLTAWVRRNHENLRSPQGRAVVRAIRLCLDHISRADNKPLVQEIVKEELPLISDWLQAKVGIDRGNREGINRNWTYGTLIAKQAHWHLAELSFDSEKHNVFWPEYLGMGKLEQGYEYIELTSLNSLLQEAKKMHHCVPSYLDRCLEGTVCLFHLFKAGPNPERATLEISRSGASSWKISQLKGPCNIRASEGMWDAASGILKRLSGKQTGY